MDRIGNSYSNKTLHRDFLSVEKCDEYELFKENNHVVAMAYKDCDKDYYRRDIIAQLWYTEAGGIMGRFYGGYDLCTKQLEITMKEVIDSES